MPHAKVRSEGRPVVSAHHGVRRRGSDPRAGRRSRSSPAHQLRGEGRPAFIDLLPEAVVVIGADGTLQHMNERAESLLGLEPRAVGAPLTEVLDVRDDSGTSLGDALVARANPVADRLAEHVLTAHLPDGRTRAVSVAGRRREHGGAVLTFRHAGRRERLDALRSDLVATVSHEIRAPLASVKGFTRTLLKKWDRFSDEQKHQMLETIDADADRVTRLLTELLDVSRIDAGRVRLDRRMVEIDRLVAGIADRFARVVEGPDISVGADDDVPAAYVDPDKVEQVLTNLVENALRHAPDSPIRLEVSATNGEVLVTVSDDGPGIPEEQQLQIFEKFARGRGDRRAGTGLGLYITKGLVEAHGGQVTVSSAPGEGADFTVALPAGEPDLTAS